MRFKQFLSELDDVDIKKMMDSVKTECSEFLYEFGDRPVLRGEAADYIAQKNSVRQDRKARDTGISQNLIYSLGVESVFGVQQVRRQALFGTGNMRIVADYGNKYFIFPVNGYKGIYSETIKDVAFAEWQEKFDELYKSIIDEIYDRFGADADALMTEYIKHIASRDNMTKINIKGIEEQMSILDNGYEVADFIVGECSKFINTHYSKKYTKAALGNEILFYNVPHYYSFSVEHMRETFNMSSMTTTIPDVYLELLKRIKG